MTALAESAMQTAMPILRITACPRLSQARDVQVFVAAVSYFAMETSKRAASIFSLPKYLTVSKFRRLSMALELASVSLSFISRRIPIRQLEHLIVNQT